MHGKVAITRWVHSDEEHTGIPKTRSRLVGRDIDRKTRMDLVTGTTLLEHLKQLVADCAQGKTRQTPNRNGCVGREQGHIVTLLPQGRCTPKSLKRIGKRVTKTEMNVGS